MYFPFTSNIFDVPSLFLLTPLCLSVSLSLCLSLSASHCCSLSVSVSPVFPLHSLTAMESMVKVALPKKVRQRPLLQQHHPPSTENKLEHLLCCGEVEHYNSEDDDYGEVEPSSIPFNIDTAAGPHQHPVLATIMSVSFLVGIIIFILVWMS